MKKGYKAFELRDGKLWCGKVQFMPGNIYKQSGSFLPLENLLHYSEDILSLDLTSYGVGVVDYSPDTVIYEIEDLGDYTVEDPFFVDSSRVITNRIKVIREIEKSQYPFRFNEKGDITYKKDYKGEEYTWQYEYNKNGHMTYKKYPSGEEFHYEYQYDSSNNVIYENDLENLEQRYYTYDSNNIICNNFTSRTIFKSNSCVSKESWKYDKVGRPLYCKRSDGIELFYEYKSDRTSIYYKDRYAESNQKVLTEYFEYDKRNRLIFRIYSDGTQAEWRYDKRGNVIRYQDYEGEIHTFEYNDKNEMISYKDYSGNEIRSI